MSSQITNKIVILGDLGVGKSSIVNRLISGNFFEGTDSTIGAAYNKVTFQGMTLNIWDTAGQEKFRSIAPIYYRNAKVAIIVFDVSREINTSFKSIDYWIKHLDECKIFIIGNKIDLVPEQPIDKYKQNKIYYVSARDDVGITELFQEVVSYLMLSNSIQYDINKSDNKNENKNINLNPIENGMDDLIESQCYC